MKPIEIKQIIKFDKQKIKREKSKQKRKQKWLHSKVKESKFKRLRFKSYQKIYESLTRVFYEIV